MIKTLKLLSALIGSLLLCQSALALDVERFADAIYRAEGGAKTRYPYGVKSVECSGERECRKVTVNSIRNNLKRYERSDKRKPFVEFMADRWVSIEADREGHKNWVKNVTKIYNRRFKDEDYQK